MKRFLSFSLLILLSSCTILSTIVVKTSDSGTKQGHIKYLNRINSKKEIYKAFKIIAQDELTHVNGNEYQIIIISDLPNTNDNSFISSGDKTLDAKRPSLRGYVEFHLQNDQVIFWESRDIIYPQYPNLEWHGILLDVAALAGYFSYLMLAGI
jgi:hypothetical protein